MDTSTAITGFVAVGDSSTEGMSDELPDGSHRGWADLVAARPARQSPGFRYANLAVRGKLIGQIADEQVDVAAGFGADPVSLMGGLNDVMRPRCDVEAVCARFEEAAAKPAASCGQLVLFRSADPSRRSPRAARLMPRIRRLTEVLERTAARHGAVVVPLADNTVFDDLRMWAEGRLRLSAEGHRRVAEAVLRAIGRPPSFDWREPLPAAPAVRWSARRRADLRWARVHLLPWIGRRLTGRSSGDGRPPKRPDLLPPVGQDAP